MESWDHRASRRRVGTRRSSRSGRCGWSASCAQRPASGTARSSGSPIRSAVASSRCARGSTRPRSTRARRFPPTSLAAIQEEHTTSGAHRLCEQAFPDWVPNDVLQAAEDLSVDDALAERSRASGPPERGGNRFGPRRGCPRAPVVRVTAVSATTPPTRVAPPLDDGPLVVNFDPALFPVVATADDGNPQDVSVVSATEPSARTASSITTTRSPATADTP